MTNKYTDKNGFIYTQVDQDIHKVRIYTLQNGLTVYLAQNFDLPRIQTYIAVKVGSNQDPKDNTGLAHYLEHLMFKGTKNIGTKNWEKEKKYLEQIEELYEKHKQTKNQQEKKNIYKEIDQISLEASKYAIANEYDKCISSLGAIGTNAHTWIEETVYKNNIPNNELEKFLKIEAERFSEITPRLFHTELETVYEEFNRAQDNDAYTTHNALWEMLFPTHPMGQQTTLGKAEHLKNPSIKEIKKFFETYYVPNNMAIVMVGDLEYDNTILLIQKYFGQLKNKQIPTTEKIIEKPIKNIQKRIVKSPTTPRLHIAWRGAGYKNKEMILLDLISNILYNRGACGLIDLNINFAQKALYAQSYLSTHNEYSTFEMVIIPKENQTLDQGKELLLKEINNIKEGNFPDDILKTIVKDFKIQRIKELETAKGLATNLYQTYIRQQSWEEEITELSAYERITKKEIVDFANSFFIDNYAIVYKEKGKNKNIIVEKPEITPININTTDSSEFLKNIISTKTTDIKPKFIDYKKAISHSEINGRKFSFVKNTDNNLASLYFIIPIGKKHDKEIDLAIRIIHYLGTEKYSPDQLKIELYKIGVEIDFKIKKEEISISLLGLEENLEDGIKLLWHWLDNIQPNEEEYKKLIQTIEEGREAAKQSKEKISEAIQKYARYGREYIHKNILSSDELKNITSKKLIDKIKKLTSYPFEIFYYGNRKENIQQCLSKTLLPITLEIPEPKEYPQQDTNGKVYFVEYDMVQTEFFQIAKASKVSPEHFGRINLFNEYFGNGLSSIVFQEIRERKSLAYSSYVYQQTGSKKDDYDYVSIYLGTQPDKLPIALDTVHTLMKDFPEIDLQFEYAKTSALKKISSGRIVRTNIFFTYHQLKKLGIEKDIRQIMYNEIQDTTLVDLKKYYQNMFDTLAFNTALVGKYDNIPWQELKDLGTVEVLSLEEVFGY